MKGHNKVDPALFICFCILSQPPQGLQAEVLGLSKSRLSTEAQLASLLGAQIGLSTGMKFGFNRLVALQTLKAGSFRSGYSPDRIRTASLGFCPGSIQERASKHLRLSLSREA